MNIYIYKINKYFFSLVNLQFQLYYKPIVIFRVASGLDESATLEGTASQASSERSRVWGK